MDKRTFIKNIQTEANIEIPMKDIEEILSTIESVVKNAILNNEEVAIPGICKIKVKTVPERSGVTNLGGVKKTWIKPEHKETYIKILSSLKNIFE